MVKILLIYLDQFHRSVGTGSVHIDCFRAPTSMVVLREVSCSISISSNSQTASMTGNSVLSKTLVNSSTEG